MPHSRTHQDPEQLARATAAESVARNAHGQSLDDARESFRAEWQAKVDRKRKQAEWALAAAAEFEFWTVFGAISTAALGTVLGGVVGGGFAHFLSAVLMALIGAVLGIILAQVPLALGYLCVWLCRRRAKCLEREVEKLERS